MDYYSYQNLVSSNQNLPNDRTHLDPRLNNCVTFSLQPFAETLTLSQKFNNDSNKQFIDTWLMEKGKLLNTSINIKPNIKKTKNDISINVARKSLKSCLEIVRLLNETQEALRNNVDTMSSAEWKQKTLEIGNLRDEFDKLMTKLEDKASISALKLAVKRRTKKRLNQKRRKASRKELIVLRNEQRVQAHKNIDKWLEGKKEEAERAKMEEKFKMDADCVLYEVIKKKSEARKQLSLISALVKLRNVRDSMATQRGEKVLLEDRQAFGLVTEKLIRMWENSTQNYSKEEQCLQVMLEHNATADSNAVRLARESAVAEEWENLLFGSKQHDHLNNPTYWALTSADRDLETFIAIRRSWDTFLVGTKKTGSSIPVGWVIPPNNPSDNWANHIRM